MRIAVEVGFGFPGGNRSFTFDNVDENLTEEEINEMVAAAIYDDISISWERIG